MTIQQIIKDIMQKKGIRQAEMARRLGLHRQSVEQTLKSKEMYFSTVSFYLNRLGYTIKIVKNGEFDGLKGR